MDREKIKRAMPFFISIILVVIISLVEFTVLSVNDSIDIKSFTINIVVNSLLIIAASVTWLASGVDRGKRTTGTAYKLNLEAYGQKVAFINEHKQLLALKEFCDLKNLELKYKKIERYLLGAFIDSATYEIIKNISKKELLENGYEKWQIRRIQKVQKDKIKVKGIDVKELIADSEKNYDEYGVHYNEKAEKAARVLVRAVKSIVVAFVFTLLAIELTSNITDITAWIMLLMKVCTIVYTSWSAEREGYEQITDTRNKVILKRKLFLDLFSEHLESETLRT